MKAFRKLTALLLTAFLIAEAAIPASAAGFVDSSAGNKVILRNDFIKVTVNADNGRFGIRTADGQPIRKNDKNTSLTFKGDDPETSFTTFRINGTDYIFGNAYDIDLGNGSSVHSQLGETQILTSKTNETIPDGCQAIVTPWSVEGVVITQILLLAPESDIENGGNVQIYYQIDNRSGADVSAGARILLDTMVGANDGPQFQIGTISSNTLKVERMLSYDPVNDQGVKEENKNYYTLPGYWVMKDTLDPTSPLATNVTAYGYTGIAGYRDVDYMIVSHWNKLANNKFEEFEDYKAVRTGNLVKGSSEINPNLDFTNDKNEYGSADSAVAFYWNPMNMPDGSSMQLGTVYGLGEIVDPSSVLSVTFPNPVTQAEIDPDNPKKYKDDGVFDINVEVENLSSYNMEHSSIDIQMLLEKNLRFVKRDDLGNIIRDENGVPLTVYSPTQTITYQKALTPEQAESGESSYIEPGEKIGVTFTVMAIGKPWPTTRQYLVTASSPELERQFEDRYGNTASEDIKAMYNSSRANFIFLPPVGEGTRTYSSSVSPEEYFTTDPKYISLNITNIEAYNPGSSVRGQESDPNFNLYLQETVTGQRYKVDVLDNVQCVPTDDGLTGDMRISYNKGTRVDESGEAIDPDEELGPELPVGEYKIIVDYISTEEDENELFDFTSGQSFLVTTNEVSKVREPGILAVVKETIDFSDGDIFSIVEELTGTIEEVLGELESAVDELQNFDVGEALYDELKDFGKELISPITDIMDRIEDLTDFDNIEREIAELSQTMGELNDIDFSCLEDFDLEEAISGITGGAEVNIDFSKAIDIDGILKGPFGVSSYDELEEYGNRLFKPFTDIADEIEDLTDFRNITAEMDELSNSMEDLKDVDFSCLADFDLCDAIKSITSNTDFTIDFSKAVDFETIRKGPFGDYGYKDLDDFGRQLAKPVLDIIDEVENLADFANIEKDIDGLSKDMDSLDEIDFSCLADFSLSEAIGGIVGSTKFKIDFSKAIDIDGIKKGPVDKDGKTFELPSFEGLSLDSLTEWAEKWSTALTEWVDKVKHAIDFGKDTYELAKKIKDIFENNRNVQAVKDGAKDLLDYYNKYLDINVSVDWSAVGDKNSAAAGKTYSEAQKTATAFVAMYAKMKSIYSQVHNKIDQAQSIYDKTMSIVDTVKNIVTNPTDVGNIVESLNIETLNKWLDAVKRAISFGEDIYNLAKDIYEGKFGDIKTGAQKLLEFYNKYFSVNVSVDWSAVGDKNKSAAAETYSQAQKAAVAFTAMYARLNSIYGKLKAKLDQVMSIYDQAMEIVDTVKNLVSDPSTALSALDKFTSGAMSEWVDKVKNAITFVKDTYNLAKDAFQGKMDIKEGGARLLEYYNKYFDVSVDVDFTAVGDKNTEAAKKTYEQGEKIATAFIAMYAKMKNIYSTVGGKMDQATSIYDQAMEIVDSITKIFNDPAGGVNALIDMVKDRIMAKLDEMGVYKETFRKILDKIENFEDFMQNPDAIIDSVKSMVIDSARVTADQWLYTELYGGMVTAANALDPNSKESFDFSTAKKTLPSYSLKAFADQEEYDEYVKKVEEKNSKKGTTDGVMVKITGLIRQTGEGEDETNFIVDTSTEPAIINDTVAFSGSDLIFTRGTLKITLGPKEFDLGALINEAQSMYGGTTPLFDTLFVSGTGTLSIAGSGFLFHEGEWSLDFYNGFDKVLDPVKDENEEEEEESSKAPEDDALNETAAWAIGALNDLANPFKALTIEDVYFNRHTLFSAPNFSVAGFGLKFDNYLLRSGEVCFGGHIDFKIVKGEIQNVFFTGSGLQSIEADLKFDLGGNLGLLEKGNTAGGSLMIHYYDPDYVRRLKAKGYASPEEKYGLDFNAKLKNVGGVKVGLSFKRVNDGRILPDVIEFGVTPPAPGLLVTAGTYITDMRGAIRELAETIAGGSNDIPLTVQAGVDLKFGQEPAVFDGKIDMTLKRTGIQFNGKLDYKGKPMITKAEIKAQWVTPWYVSAAAEVDVMGWNIIVGNMKIYIGQNLELNRTDFEGVVSAALQIPEKIDLVGGMKLGKVTFGVNNDKIWGSVSVGIKPVAVSLGVTYYWGGGLDFSTNGENLPEAYTYLLLERPEEEPVLIAIGSGMRTEATSWVNENTVHELEYHSVDDGITLIDNGRNNIGIGGISVSNEGKTHIIPVGSVGESRDSVIEIEYFGRNIPENLTLRHDGGDGGEYPVKIGDLNNLQYGDTAFNQILETTDGVNRRVVYVLVPNSMIEDGENFRLDASEKVEVRLLSMPSAPSLDSVSVDNKGDTQFRASVKVSDAGEKDTVSLYLTKEPVSDETVPLTDENGNEKKDADGNTMMVTKDTDPGVMIYDGIPISRDGTVRQTVDLVNEDVREQSPYAVKGLGDLRQVLESGDYYLRAALKGETTFNADTSKDTIHISDPMAPTPVKAVKLESAGSGYFNLGFDAVEGANAYVIDFFDESGAICADYNGILFDADELNDNYNSDTNQFENIRMGGRTVTGGSGTAEDPYSYTGLETGRRYTARVYASFRTPEGNYHLADGTSSSTELLPEPKPVKITSIETAEDTPGTVGWMEYTDSDGTVKTSTARRLVTNMPSPTVKITVDQPCTLEAWNGDDLVGTMADDGTLSLVGMTTDGEYAVELRTVNNATGDTSVSILDLVIDTMAPVIMMTSPVVGESVPFGSIPVEGITTAGAEVTANGTPLTVESDGTFSGTISMDESLASGQISIQAADEAGNTNSAVVTAVNNGFKMPLGLNIVRSEKLMVNGTDRIQAYLRYADGKNADGTLRYRSEKIPDADMNRLTFEVAAGDAVRISRNGVITGVREGAALVSVKYAVSDQNELEAAMPVTVEGFTEAGVLDGGISPEIDNPYAHYENTGDGNVSITVGADITFEDEDILERIRTVGANVYIVVCDAEGRMVKTSLKSIRASDIVDGHYAYSDTIQVPEDVDIGWIKMIMLNNNLIPLMEAINIK